MKRIKRKRYNRGLLAALVLILAFVGYVIAEGAMFQYEKTEIERTVREYVEQSPQLAILSPAFVNQKSSELNAAAVERKMEQNEALLREYWSFEEDEWGYNQSETLLKHVEEIVAYNARQGGVIESAKGIVQYVDSIVKTGQDEAEITFSYTGSIRYTGSPKWILFNTSPEDSEDDFNLYLSIGDVTSSSGTESVIPSGDIRAIMIKRDGRWYIDRVTYANVYNGN